MVWDGVGGWWVCKPILVLSFSLSLTIKFINFDKIVDILNIFQNIDDILNVYHPGAVHYKAPFSPSSIIPVFKRSYSFHWVWPSLPQLIIDMHLYHIKLKMVVGGEKFRLPVTSSVIAAEVLKTPPFLTIIFQAR